MADLFGIADNPYSSIYEALGEVRELFHREGRIGDANAKLDETVKLLAVHFSAATRRLPLSAYRQLQNADSFDLALLQKLFKQAATNEPFLVKDGTSIFGPRPHMSFEPGEENIAYKLFVAAGRAFVAQRDGEQSLDVLNEAFGHHVRDNFRSHTEDAQYMTPPEVVDFMVKLGSHSLKGRKEKDRKRFLMMDPSCGVGSFITAWRIEHNRQLASKMKLPPLSAVGQDKVDRMARLAM